MKTKGNHKTTMLVTDDPLLERAARRIAKDLGDALQIISNSDEATDSVFDTSRYETFAIVDADAQFGSRWMMRTIAGLVPVIAVTEKPSPWLCSMLRRHRIHAQISRPVSPDKLKKAVCRIRDTYGNDMPND